MQDDPGQPLRPAWKQPDYPPIRELQQPPHSGTYFMQDRHMEEELLRLAEQDQLVTTKMGGVLPEQADPGGFRHVLDVACGPGGWAIEAALTYTELSLVGIDINQNMLQQARARAISDHVEDRVSFYAMDALGPLGFPDATFDLVNLRFALSFARIWEWPGVINELLRVVRPGGVVRLTDEEVIHQSNSPASMQFCEMLLCALFRSGHLFAEENSGITAHLAPLLSGQGCQNVQTRAYALQFQAETPEGQIYVQDGIHMLRTLRPFVQKWGCQSNEYDAIRQHALEEIQRPDFHATWHLLTAWGIRPI
ncbi:MAG TPA: methyltransferase domain-containing protein [Ktedonosporobacter sp.]|nr:methyltransferase domain-containing protein [Ktedonosporobacter sp.]